MFKDVKPVKLFEYEGVLIPEKWKHVKGYQKKYLISNYGRVYSFYGKGRLLKPFKNTGKYPSVKLCLDCKEKTIGVHKLVAIAFLGHTPCGYKVVIDHKDNVRDHNFYLNLQLTTNRENASKDRKGGVSDHIGVNWCKQTSKWRAKMWLNGKHLCLGRFVNELDAANAYQKKLKEISK